MTVNHNNGLRRRFSEEQIAYLLHYLSLAPYPKNLNEVLASITRAWAESTWEGDVDVEAGNSEARLVCAF
ncbi:MAG: hypothetical protein ABI681_07170 [Gemmatimonadales bacterium]